jgi:hypothetical protein
MPRSRGMIAALEDAMAIENLGENSLDNLGCSVCQPMRVESHDAASRNGRRRPPAAGKSPMTDPANTTDEAQIRSILEGWATATRKGQKDQVLANHLSDVLIYTSSRR